MDIIVPFYIPASGAAPGAITRLRPQQGITGGCIRLTVVSGGPVFLFEADISAQEAYDKTHGIGGREVDFDLAATPNESGELRKESLPSLMTLHSDNETVGYVQLTGKEHYAYSMAETGKHAGH